jgi:accessory gene regulator B
MSKIEQLSGIVANKLSKTLLVDNDKEEILAYGAFVLFQTVLSILMVVLFGILFDVLFEALIISFSASLLRKFSGGAHANSPINCAIIGMILFGGQAIILKILISRINYLFLILIVIIAFLYTYRIIIKYSPVGTSTKPLKNEKTRKRLKRKSINFVTTLFILSFFIILVYVQTSKIYLLTIISGISMGIVWQSITMVSLGHKIIDGFDKFLGGTNRFLRRII